MLKIRLILETMSLKRKFNSHERLCKRQQWDVRFVIVYINTGYNGTEIKVFWFLNYAKDPQMIMGFEIGL